MKERDRGERMEGEEGRAKVGQEGGPTGGGVEFLRVV
jgi:hypothetical protein